MKKILLIVTSFLLVSNLTLFAADSHAAARDKKEKSKQQQKETFYDILKKHPTITDAVDANFITMVAEAYVDAGIGIKTPDVSPEKRLEILEYLKSEIRKRKDALNNVYYLAYLSDLEEQASQDLNAKLERLKLKAAEEEALQLKIAVQKQKEEAERQRRREIAERKEEERLKQEEEEGKAVKAAVKEHKEAAKNQRAAQKEGTRKHQQEVEKYRKKRAEEDRRKIQESQKEVDEKITGIFRGESALVNGTTAKNSKEEGFVRIQKALKTLNRLEEKSAEEKLEQARRDLQRAEERQREKEKALEQRKQQEEILRAELEQAERDLQRAEERQRAEEEADGKQPLRGAHSGFFDDLFKQYSAASPEQRLGYREIFQGDLKIQGLFDSWDRNLSQ